MRNCYTCAEPREGASAYCEPCGQRVQSAIVERRTGVCSGRANPRPRGTRQTQCPLCHELFSGEATYVWHRIDGGYPSQPGGFFLRGCRYPESKGMTLNEHGVWTRPS